MNEKPNDMNEENFEETELKKDKMEDEKRFEKEKKEQEVRLKKKQSFPLNQSTDTITEDSVWGSFRIRPAESLEIIESELIYRTPLTNIIESENEFYLFIELPGLNKKNVEITLQEGILEIIGEKTIKHKDKKEEKKEKEKKEEKEKKDKEKKDKKKEKDKEIKGEYLRREFSSASFYRSFLIPEDINIEGIDASFKNGVLRLKIPKKTTETTEKQVIEIK